MAATAGQLTNHRSITSKTVTNESVTLLHTLLGQDLPEKESV